MSLVFAVCCCCLTAASDSRRRLRLGFIRKVYSILSLQLALTAAVAAALSLVRPAREFVLATPSLTWLGFARSSVRESPGF